MSPTFRGLPVAFFAAALALGSLKGAAESSDTSNRWQLQAGGESTADGIEVKLDKE